MTRKSSAACLCLVLAATFALAENKKPKPKQEAKDYYEQATKQNDPVEKAHLACQAAQLEPKEKRYSEECARDQQALQALNQADANNLQAAKDAFQAHQYDKAEASARAVTSSNEKTHGQAVELIGQIENAKNLALVQSSWVKGDFDAVKAYYFKITDPTAQATAKKTLDLIELYNNDIAKARVAAVDNPKGAIEQYEMAYKTNPHGPVDVQAKIAELKNIPQPTHNEPKPTQQQAQQTPPPPATPGNVATLLSSARDAEKAGRLPEALSDFQAVLQAQPNNGTAKAGVARVQPQLQAAADHKAIHDALRAFYDFKFDDAQSQLESYLKASPAPLNPGVANFYLGAALLEQSMLKTPQAQWQGPPAEVEAAFKEARKANYKPAAKYVSPAILKVWDSSGQ